MPETPEQKARREIDAKLIASGWIVQDRADLDLTAGRGIAVREFPMKSGFGFADYLLYLDRKALGAVEAKATGPLTGVEPQSAKYAAGLPDKLSPHRRPLPFLFESNGAVTFFTNGLDPRPRSRKVFSFPRPETLAAWLDQPQPLRASLRHLPPLDETGLWKVQIQAIAELEKSFAKADPRALIQMATGSGKTFASRRFNAQRRSRPHCVSERRREPWHPDLPGPHRRHVDVPTHLQGGGGRGEASLARQHPVQASDRGSREVGVGRGQGSDRGCGGAAQHRPADPEGKAIASRNRTGHGIYAMSPVIDGLESAEDWSAYSTATCTNCNDCKRQEMDN